MPAKPRFVPDDPPAVEEDRCEDTMQDDGEEEASDDEVHDMIPVNVEEALPRVIKAFPSILRNMRAWGRVNLYHNPSLRGGFVTTRNDNVITAERQEDNFSLKIDLTRALTSRKKSMIDGDDLVDGNYPYLDIDNVNRFFLPHDSMQCTVRINEDRDGVSGPINIDVEGYMCLATQEIRVDAVNQFVLSTSSCYFWFSISGGAY